MTARSIDSVIPKKQSHPRSHLRRGASVIVETALCLTIVILPTSLGILQYGIVMNASNQVEQIAREGGRFAAVHCLEPTFDGSETQASPPSLRYYLKNNIVKNKTTIAWADIDGAVRTGAGTEGYIQVTPSTVAARVSGQAISVKVCYPMSRKIFVGKVVPGVSTLSNDYNTTSTFNIE
ncbi:pilus assembly protein [bacterium]|nr:MAG: pilus assembly protein [bacterium]